MLSFLSRVPTGLRLAPLLLLATCSRPTAESQAPVPPAVDAHAVLKQQLVANYAALVHTNYQDALQAALNLQEAVKAFLANPSEEKLSVAKERWLASRVPYLQSEAYRFYDGPIDDVNGPEGLLNAWPMDERYVDYVVGFPSSGIIADTTRYPELTKKLLRALNEKDGEANIATGFHAVEFLLWGQDLSETGPGARPYTDFVRGRADFAERRALYLSLTVAMLVEDLQYLVDAWAPDAADNYRAGFVASDRALDHILEGVGRLCGAELAGERMAVPMATREQEDEQSCFSDNTHMDVLMNARALNNVYRGRYETLAGKAHDGPGLEDLMGVVNADLNRRVLAQLESVMQSCAAIPVPFDRAVQEDASRPAVQTAIDDLRTLTRLFVEVAGALDITLNLEA
ncbi:imelysin family protein [Acanthopleuribacter pedis]|uniref:Imelysin-like domain-containing protein n=1 Tax=Acanthopleuribacter pedis TaxID=442870 RepID=A0A8J7QBA3_9BACT|nr:imelysin family protein [Acanthopleuribacter pedis]MBO1320934.1 hypothetical protein [Acanthopleuribacter pedis]